MLSVALSVCLMVLATTAAVGARLAVDHRIVQTAADLAALAGAADLVLEPDAVCRHAADVASANSTRVAICRVDQGTLWVTVTRDAVRGVSVRATAHAGLDGSAGYDGVEQK